MSDSTVGGQQGYNHSTACTIIWRQTLSAPEGVMEAQSFQYPLFPAASMACRALGVDLETVLVDAKHEDRQADLRQTFVDAATYFRLWEAVLARSPRPDAIAFLGKTMANGPVIPAFFALSSAPTLRVGFARLARYKRLIGPTAIAIQETTDTVTLTFLSEVQEAPMPASLGALHLVFAAERARTLTASEVRPLSATLPSGAGVFEGVSEDLGITPDPDRTSSIVFSSADMNTPLVSRDDVLWKDVELDLEVQRVAHSASATMAARIAGLLVELLPSGDATVDRVAYALGLSVSTLQRRLRDEGREFREIVRESREHLARRYLTKTDIAPNEIAALLGYREPNSFYRSFKSWTGMTPLTFRESNRAASGLVR